MSKMVKSLTKANAAKSGIEVAKDYDFEDDGNHFHGFIYKGMPMTQCYCKKDGTVYLCIRVDYLNNNFTYKEWMATEEYYLCDKFNGVSEFDIEELVENLEKVIAKVDEMNVSASVDQNDLMNVKNAVLEEVDKIQKYIDKDVKINFKWWAIPEYRLSIISRYMKTLEEKIGVGINVIRTIDMMDIRRQKEWIENSKRSNILGADFYMKAISEYMDKH